MGILRTQKFGASIRKLYEAALKNKKALYECLKCGKVKVRRKGYAVWQCRSCESCFAGAAYMLNSEAGNICTRLLKEYEKMA